MDYGGEDEAMVDPERMQRLMKRSVLWCFSKRRRRRKRRRGSRSDRSLRMRMRMKMQRKKTMTKGPLKKTATKNS
jgi:hypothetical protein